MVTIDVPLRARSQTLWVCNLAQIANAVQGPFLPRPVCLCVCDCCHSSSGPGVRRAARCGDLLVPCLHYWTFFTSEYHYFWGCSLLLLLLCATLMCSAIQLGPAQLFHVADYPVKHEGDKFGMRFPRLGDRGLKTILYTNILHSMLKNIPVTYTPLSS